MKKLISVLIVIVMGFALMSGCQLVTKDVSDIPVIEFDPLPDIVLDRSSSNMNAPMVQRIENVQFEKPKNVIFMIGDGMGFASVEAARILRGGAYEDKLSMEYLPVKGEATTYSTSTVTDSAAAGTALATGYKTNNGVVGKDHNLNIVKNLSELAAEKGKKTGIVATKSVTDATPAAFTAHVDGRSEESYIALQQINRMMNGMNLILGGGYSPYTAAENQTKLAEAQAAGVTFTNDWETALETEDKLIGVFSDMAMDINQSPNLMQMTQKALDTLDCEEGFFLMIEGSKIDIENHANNLEGMTRELKDFDESVALAIRYTVEHPDTVLIITADHETGGLVLPENPGPDNIYEAEYTTSGHTNKNVPVFALGYGTQALSGVVDNTDISKFIASVLGDSDFGKESEKEYIDALKSRLALSNDILKTDLSINEIMSPYYDIIFENERIIDYNINEVEHKKEILASEIECPIPNLVIIKNKSDNISDYKLKTMQIYVPLRTSVEVLGKNLNRDVTENHIVYSCDIEFETDFTDSIDIVFTYQGDTYTMKKFVPMEFSALSELADFESESFAEGLKSTSLNVYDKGYIKLLEVDGQTVVSVDFNKDLKRGLRFPKESFVDENNNFQGYNSIRIIYTNNGDTDIKVPNLQLGVGVSFKTCDADREILKAGETSVVYYDMSSVGDDPLKKVSYVGLVYPDTLNESSVNCIINGLYLVNLI